MSDKLSSQQSIAVRVMQQLCPTLDEFFIHWTEGHTIVLEGRSESTVAILKATAEYDVRAEKLTCELVRRAGVPAPEILAEGWEPDLPGSHWFIMQAADGDSWDPCKYEDLIPRVQEELASLLFRVHRIHRPGFGPITIEGHGQYASWIDWLTCEARKATEDLRVAGYLRHDLDDQLEKVFARRRAALDTSAGSLLHGDLDPKEIFIDTSNGSVLGIIDWGDAVVGDPLFDLARFAAGGPAEDTRPSWLQPGLIREYLLRDPSIASRAKEAVSVYRMIWGFRHSASYLGDPGEPDWTPGLCTQAMRFLERVV